MAKREKAGFEIIPHCAGKEKGATKMTADTELSKNQSKRKMLKSIAGRVLEKYPKTFFGKDSPDTVPLKVGIVDDLVKENPEVPPFMFRLFLERYALKTRYLVATAKGGPRFDLAGLPNGEVSPSQREYAMKKLIERGVAVNA